MKAIIFTRVSSTSDRQNTDRQTSDLRSYAQAFNIKVIKEYSEKISGAKRNAERPILMDAIDYAIANKVDVILVSELSRIGRDVLEIQETIKKLADHGVNLYCQKEQFSLLDASGKLSAFAPIMIATLATCAQLEREAIKFRLNSGRQKYIADGGILGRKKGSVRSIEETKSKYKGLIKELKAGTSIRKAAKLCDCSVSTVQRVKKILNI